MFPGAQLQSVFAFTVGGILFVASLAVGVPRLWQSGPLLRQDIVCRDREKAPLLADGSDGSD